MNNKFTFLGGLFTGIGVGYLLTKNYFNKLTMKKVDEAEKSIKEAFMDKLDDFEKAESNIENDIPQEEVKELKKPYDNLIRSYSTETTDYHKMSNVEIESTRITIITEDEFGEDQDYDIKTLTRYTDGTIMDDNQKVYSKPEEYLGNGALKLLNKMDDEKLDMFYIKNPILKIYYEVLRSEMSFEELLGEDPWLKRKIESNSEMEV